MAFFGSDLRENSFFDFFEISDQKVSRQEFDITQANQENQKGEAEKEKN